MLRTNELCFNTDKIERRLYLSTFTFHNINVSSVNNKSMFMRLFIFSVYHRVNISVHP